MSGFEFAEDLVWINAGGGLRLREELRGRVVLLFFWTATCVHCRNVLADLDYLRGRFAGRAFVIVGVHVGKYGEGEREVRAAVRRLGMVDAVVIDRERAIWGAFGVRSWPTVVLLGADGGTVGAISGEGHRVLLERAVERALAAGEAVLAARPLEVRRDDFVLPAGALSYPSKVLADWQGRRLIVLDSGHHRVVIGSWPDGEGNVVVERVIGTGKAGLGDGDFGVASFRGPEGAVMGGGRGDVLWIADTGNHCIRRVDLREERVVTVLGTGEREFENEGGKTGREQPLNSPRDVALLGNRLYISQAGQHQIFAMNLMTGMTEVAAGTGREGLRDGDAGRAHLGQPSGLAMDGGRQILYFADAENSAVRGLDLRTKVVSTLVGKGLFEFGDVDGDFEGARFQHCMGVSLAGDGMRILVGDTGNHKVKVMDLGLRTVRSVGGGGVLFEPGGVAWGNGAEGLDEVFVADTGNHRVVRLDVGSGAWKEITFQGLGGV